jgi:hypothetical protein
MATYRSSSNTTSRTSQNPIAGLLGLGVVSVSIWGLVCAARVILGAVSVIVDVLFGTAPSTLIGSVILSAFAGAFAGIALALLRSLRRKPDAVSKSFLSALFNKGLAGSFDAGFWGRALISGTVGLLIGAITGASGAISFPQFFNGSASSILSAGSLPLMAFVGGGFGGPGGTGFWSMLFLILVLILMGLIVGILSGLIVHLVVAAAAGATKGATKEAVLRALEESDEEPQPHRIRNGVVRGALTGIVVAILESIFTVWGILALP